MKHTKRLLVLLLVAVHVLTLGFTAGAAMDEHEFTAYEIFDGTQASTGELGAVVWGSGIKGDEFLAALKADPSIGSAFTTCTTAVEVAEVLSTYASYSDFANRFAAIAHHYVQGTGTPVEPHVSTLDAGYYLIVDTTTSVPEQNFVYNLSLLHLSTNGTFGVEEKVSIPDIQKKVKDVNDSKKDSLTDWQDSADYDIGDLVPFQLTATMPSKLTGFDTYTLIFHDTLSTGLTFDETTAELTVTIDGTLVSTGYTVSCPDGHTLTVVFDDVLALGATTQSEIVVEYKALLNEDAVIGGEGNPNEVYLEYSNNPNHDDDSTTKSKKDTAVVFTYELFIEKVDELHQDLAGAEFALYKFVADDAGSETYKGQTGDWVIVGTQKVGVALNGTVANEFEWKGIDDGEYMLVEAVVPDGYNPLEPVYFYVTAEHTESGTIKEIELISTDLTTDVNIATGTMLTDIVNKKGTLLPSTGGKGTTILITLGCILFVITGVVLVTKKRLYNAD